MRLTDYDKLQYDLVNALLECKDPSLGEPYEKGFKDGVRHALCIVRGQKKYTLTEEKSNG